MTIDLNELDLAESDLYVTGDALGTFRYLQENAPVFWNRRQGKPSFWALTRYRDAVAVYRDRETYTSEHGMQVGQEESAARAAAGKMLIVTDYERHNQLRDVMNPTLTPRVARRLEGAMRRTVRRTLIGAAGTGVFDFVSTVAGPLPLSVICQLLGVPEPDWHLMIDWTRTAFGSTTADNPVTDAEKAEANANIFAYYAALLHERRRAPADDVISSLISGHIDGRPLTDEEILLNIQGLITGGNETTRHASAGAMIALIENPDQWQRLKRDRSLIPTTVEEVLRWTAPSLNVMRMALRDVWVGGQLVRAGERVSIWHPAVNRDEEVFPNAHKFDVGRTPNKHLTFGLGHHLCIGAALARFELKILLEELASQVAHAELAGPVKRLRSNLMWGVDRVPVRVTLESSKN